VPRAKPFFGLLTAVTTSWKTPQRGSPGGKNRLAGVETTEIRVWAVGYCPSMGVVVTPGKDQSPLARASIMDGSCGGSDLGCNEI